MVRSPSGSTRTATNLNLNAQQIEREVVSIRNLVLILLSRLVECKCHARVKQCGVCDVVDKSKGKSKHLMNIGFGVDPDFAQGEAIFVVSQFSYVIDLLLGLV